MTKLVTGGGEVICAEKLPVGTQERIPASNETGSHVGNLLWTLQGGYFLQRPQSDSLAPVKAK